MINKNRPMVSARNPVGFPFCFYEIPQSLIMKKSQTSLKQVMIHLAELVPEFKCITFVLSMYFLILYYDLVLVYCFNGYFYPSIFIINGICEWCFSTSLGILLWSCIMHIGISFWMSTYLLKYFPQFRFIASKVLSLDS